VAVGSELIPNTRKILIVDDDAELRDALTEQLLPHEEFQAAASVIQPNVLFEILFLIKSI
jgi:CheY-like chemotaxis protein